MRKENKHIRKQKLLGIMAILLLTTAAYVPAMKAGYIWDDDVYLTKNPLIVAPDGLRRIWFSLDSPSQYFPLVYTMFRLEHSIWGMNATGYHVTNIILHNANALLVWLILSKLRIRGSWLAAAIWAIHPVNVESVAWITERKNTLSTIFYLSSLAAWINFLDKEKYVYYITALLFAISALLAKTTACTLPVTLLILLWLRNGALRSSKTPHKSSREPMPLVVDGVAKRGFQLLPFVLVSVAMAIVSVWWEQNHQGTKGPEFAFTFLQRILIASRAIWFYIGKLILPVRLTFSYPRWQLDTRDPAQYVWLVLCITVALAIWKWRARIGKLPIAASLFFVCALAPTLGFVSVYTFKYSFVADHYQYVASLAPIAIAGYVLAGTNSRTNYIFPAIVLCVLTVLTWRQALIYHDEEVLWRDTIVKNPNSTMAYKNLGLFLMNEGRLDEALVAYGEVLKRKPRDPEAFYNVAGVLIAQGYTEQAKMFLLKSLEIDPNFARSHANLAVILAAEGRPNEAIWHLEKAVANAPKNREIRYNLGLLLARQGRLEESVKEFEELVRLQPDMAEAHYQLGLSLLRLGRSGEAVSHLKEALRLRPDDSRVLSLLDNLGK